MISFCISPAIRGRPGERLADPSYFAATSSRYQRSRVSGVTILESYGSAIGAMFGALIFGVVQMGIFYTGIDTDWFKLFMGATMVIAVLFNSYVRTRAMRSR